MKSPLVHRRLVFPRCSFCRVRRAEGLAGRPPMGEARLAKDRRENVSFLGGSWRRMRTKTEAVKSIGEGMLRRVGGVWRTGGLEDWRFFSAKSVARRVAGYPRGCHAHAACCQAWTRISPWQGAIIRRLVARLIRAFFGGCPSEPSQPRVPGHLEHAARQPHTYR